MCLTRGSVIFDQIVAMFLHDGLLSLTRLWQCVLHDALLSLTRFWQFFLHVVL